MSIARIEIMKNFSRAAMEYDVRAQFQHSETARVLDAALMIFPEHAQVVDIGCGTGYFAEIAKTKRPEWNIIGIDIAAGMCAEASHRCMAIQGDAIALPLADNSCDSLVSSLCLQWVKDLPQAFAEMARVLRPGGRAIIATLASESLLELRAATAHAALPLGMLSMLPAHHYQLALEKSGLGITLFTQDMALEYYADVPALLNSMRRIGATNPTRVSGLTGARRWKAMLVEYEKMRAPQGLPATWDRLFMVLNKPL
jgi:malonyl-CoA O-methyltransferase